MVSFKTTKTHFLQKKNETTGRKEKLLPFSATEKEKKTREGV